MTPYERGYDVGYWGGCDSCPYDEGTPEYNDWMNGYFDGVEELQMEEAYDGQDS
jgi:hypothetical protein